KEASKAACPTIYEVSKLEVDIPMSKSRDTDDILDAMPPRNRLKRLALLVSIPAFVFLVLLLILWNTFFKYVPPGHMLVVISKSGEPLGENQGLADEGQKGIQRRVRGEGWHFVLPVVYTTEVKPNVEIPPGKVGIVKSEGGAQPEGRVLAEEGERGIR